MTEVARLLTAARVHERNRVASANRRSAGQPQPDYVAATASAQLALDARLEAHTLDPEHADPAWAGDRLSHNQQLQWLRDYISRP